MSPNATATPRTSQPQSLAVRGSAYLLTALLAACGGANATTPRDALDQQENSLAQQARMSSPLVAAATPNTPPNGRWAQLQVTTAHSRAPFVGEIATINRRVLLLDLSAGEHGRISATGTVCSLDVETSTSMASTIVPPAMVEAMPPLDWAGEARGNEIAFERNFELLGLRDLAPDAPLPADADAYAFDADEDGNPGVTIQVTGMAGGEMYFAQRTWRDLTVTRWDGAVLDGDIVWDSERVLFGATSRALRNSEPATPSADPADNWFRSTRVRDDATCEDLTNAADILFAR